MASPAVFNAAAEATIGRALAICTQRGEEYQDSWDLNNLKAPFLTHTLSNVKLLDGSIVQPATIRLIMLAALADVKLSRLVGGWKDDTAVDLINYVAAYAELRQQYDTTPREGK